MKDETRQEISAAFAKDYTDWIVKTGGYAKDMTLRDYFAAKAMQAVYEKHWDMFMEETYETSEEVVSGATNDAYALADAMLKERNK